MKNKYLTADEMVAINQNIEYLEDQMISNMHLIKEYVANGFFYRCEEVYSTLQHNKKLLGCIEFILNMVGNFSVQKEDAKIITNRLTEKMEL